jgi:hypothetical protein
VGWGLEAGVFFRDEDDARGEETNDVERDESNGEW